MSGIAFYNAYTAMKAYQSNLDVVSNNLANVNTIGYREDRASFDDLLYQNMNVHNNEGKKVGLIKLRVFRPFPRVQLAEAMCKVKAVAIMDKAESFSNSGGPLFNEARNSLYDLKDKPYAINYIYGLGGRDITVESYYEIFNDLFIISETDDPCDVYRYVGVRDSRFEEGGFDHKKYED